MNVNGCRWSVVCIAAVQWIATPSAWADDLMTAEEVKWHIEAMGLTDDSAAAAQALAERANAEAADVDEVRSEWDVWYRSLARGSGDRRMVSLIPNGIGVYYFEYQNATIAHEDLKSQIVDRYFDELTALSGDSGLVETLLNAHTVAHFGDGNNIRQERLRDVVRHVLAQEERSQPQIEAALALHEKNLAAIYREWKPAELMELFDRAAAWAERDFDAYLEASMRPYLLRTDARREITRAGNQILALLTGESRAKFNRDFRRVLYPPSLSNLMDDYSKAIHRADITDATRQALLDRRACFYAEYDAVIDERMAIYDRFYDPEVQRASIEAGGRLSFYGEPIPAEMTTSGEEYQARMRQWIEMEQAFRNDVQTLLAEHGVGPADPNERLPTMSAPFAADVPRQTDPTWRFYYANPVFGRPDLERMLETSEATPDQRTLARAIYDDYRREVHEKAVVLGRTVTQLDQKREEFKRESPDAAQGDDWTAFINDYARLDSEWSVALTDLQLALWTDIGMLFDESQRMRLERAVFDAQWERLSQQLRSGNMGGNERHLVAVVEEAFADRGLPAECGAVLLQYRDEATATAVDVRRRLDAVEIEMREARDAAWADNPEHQRRASRAYEEWTALFQKPASMNGRYRDLLLAAVNDADREILERAFDEENHPDLFVTSPIDLLARELAEVDDGTIDQEGIDTAAIILDNTRAQYDRNTQALMAAKKEWSGEGSEQKWARWQEDHPPPDPTRPHLDRFGPMDHLWDQRRDIAKSACTQVGRLFPQQERSALPAGIQLLLMWSEAK